MVAFARRVRVAEAALMPVVEPICADHAVRTPGTLRARNAHTACARLALMRVTTPNGFGSEYATQRTVSPERSCLLYRTSARCCGGASATAYEENAGTTSADSARRASGDATVVLLCTVVVVAINVVDVGSVVVDAALGVAPDEPPLGTVVVVVVVVVVVEVVVVVSGVTATEAPDVALVFTAFSALTRN